MISRLFKYITMIISLPYFLVLYVRHLFYDIGLFKSKKNVGVVTIAIGNLNVGGSGKTPMTKYIFNLLRSNFNVAILSRGYGRKSKGFFEVLDSGDAETYGDEALEIKKSTRAKVYVCEDRYDGIENIKKLEPSVDIVLLDDALQHRKLKTDIKILLSLYEAPYYNDQLLPFGQLRDIKMAAAYADFLITTKTPLEITAPDEVEIHHHTPFQYGETAYYSQLVYGNITNPENNQSLNDIDDCFVLGVSAIANPHVFQNKIKSLTPWAYDFYKKIDHSFFTENDCKKIEALLLNSEGHKALVLCTEKDYDKLYFAKKKYGCNFDIYILPVSVNIAFDKDAFFEEALIDLIRKNQNIE